MKCKISNFLKKTYLFKYLIIFFVLGLISVRLFNVFVYPSYEILSGVLMLGACLAGLILVWVDEVIGRENLEEANREIMEKQAELVQSEKMAALGRLAGGVAHELKNPLTGIIGSAELIIRRLQKDKKDDCGGCLNTFETVKKEGLRCQGLARNLLQFSRKKKGEMKPLDINKVIEDTLAVIGHYLNQPGSSIDIVKNLAPEAPPVFGDPDQLEQVIMNLVINSRDAMPRGGTITITTKGHDGKLLVSVRDTGTGIPEEVQSKIFEPLFTTKEEGKGTGLGLSISRDIIITHGGKISFESTCGAGTTFTIELPAAETT